MTIYKRAEPATGTGIVKGLLNSNNPSKKNYFLTKDDIIKIRPYKVYSALMTQSSSANPTVTIMENTLGGSLNWTRQFAGQYSVTNSNLLPNNKSTVFIQTPASTATFTQNFPYIAVASINSGTCSIVTTETQGFTIVDDLLIDAFIEIRVYE